MKFILIFISLYSFGISRLPHQIEKNAIKIIPLVNNVARTLEIEEELILSMIWTESHFKKSAKSSVGANGYMQIMPKTYDYLRSKYKPKDFEYLRIIFWNFSDEEFYNILYGTLYIKELRNKFKNNNLAIVSYNMGPTWTSKNINIAGKNNRYLRKVKKRLTNLRYLYFNYLY